MISKALMTLILLIGIDPIAKESDTMLDDEKTVEYVIQLRNDTVCTVTNLFVYRDKSLLLSELYAMGQIKDIVSGYAAVLDPLTDDAQILATNSMLLRLKLKNSNVDFDKMDEMLKQASNQEITELTRLWANSFGLNNSGVYLSTLAAKQRACRKHIDSIAGTRS